MAVIGSTIMIDFHLTEDADIETVRGAVRQSDSEVDATFADSVRRIVEEQVTGALEGHEVGTYTLSLGVNLVADRVPGAPRERVTVTLDFEGEDTVVAAVDDVVAPPDQARIADALESNAVDFLREHKLDTVVDVTVSVTPIEFR